MLWSAPATGFAMGKYAVAAVELQETALGRGFCNPAVAADRAGGVRLDDENPGRKRLWIRPNRQKQAAGWLPEGMQFSWRWNGGTISLIWGLRQVSVGHYPRDLWVI